MNKIIDGLVDLKGIDEVCYHYATEPYYEIEYYDLYDDIGDKNIKNSHHITEGRFRIISTCFKSSRCYKPFRMWKTNRSRSCYRCKANN